MNKKTTAGTGSVIFGVAFVWFTTHFGGGFASGAQIYSYYVRFGIWCLLMPALAMLYNGIFFAGHHADGDLGTGVDKALSHRIAVEVGDGDHIAVFEISFDFIDLIVVDPGAAGF